MPQFPEDDTSSLERARQSLYSAGVVGQSPYVTLSDSGKHQVPHEWDGRLSLRSLIGKKRVQFAGVFFIVAAIFFLISLGVAGYSLYYGGNTVSADKIEIDIQGPTTIAGGDTVPLLITITNKNSVQIENAAIEIDFPNSTRSATDALAAYPRYTERLGTLASGETVTRSVKVRLFGGEGEILSLPVSFSYGTSASNATFVKKSSYELTVSSTPLSVSIDMPIEITSGTSFTIALTARSNASVPIENVVLSGAFPFGFSVISSSIPIHGSSFLLGTLSPGASKTIMLTGTLLAQGSGQPVFHFTIGTAKTANDSALSVSYLTQDAEIKIIAPSITTTLSLNGDTSGTSVIAPGGHQSATISYTNTLPTSVSNVVVAISISGSAIDYNSIQTTRGFYRSSDHSVVFSQDSDPSLAMLAPGASGIGVFTFSTLAPSSTISSPTITFTISTSGTNVGQNGTGDANTSTTKTVKVAATATLSSSALHTSGPFSNSGPIPPQANQATTYTITWGVQNTWSALAGGTVTATLPSYVSYTGKTSGNFIYDPGSRTVTWNVGDIAQRAKAQGSFQISFTPSTSQKGGAPTLVGPATFSGHDRFSSAQISAKANPATTETTGDPGYVSANAIVQ